MRGVFRACYERFRRCTIKETNMGSAIFAVASGHCGWSRKEEEYAADFLLVCQRYLNPEDYKIFRYHYLLGADWQLCARRLAMDRGNFFHAVYRIQQTLGQAFYQLKPYPLYPVNDYFIHRPLTGPERSMGWEKDESGRPRLKIRALDGEPLAEAA